MRSRPVFFGACKEVKHPVEPFSSSFSPRGGNPFALSAVFAFLDSFFSRPTIRMFHFFSNGEQVLPLIRVIYSIFSLSLFG